VAVQIDFRRLRPAELLALGMGVLLAVSLFLPWYQLPGGREDAWSALTVAEVPAALAALVAIALVAATLVQRSPALPVALAVWTTALGLVSVLVLAVRTAVLPGMATDRCYGLWLALAASIGVVLAGCLSMRDERPFWGVSASGPSLR
jgi:hypothetical protein